MYKREYAVVCKLRHTEDEPDVADLIYRYKDDKFDWDPYIWHFVATMDRETCLEIADNLNLVENREWEDTETTSIYSDAAETGQYIF